jgi:hypothetical protein
MFRWNSQKGFLFYPCNDGLKPIIVTIDEINKSTLTKIAFKIPSERTDWKAFTDSMKFSEKEFLKQLP